MNVLSLFDGMSTLQLALKNQGFKIEKYYASEIKKHAIKITQHHFQKTIQLGDINNWEKWDIDWSRIDFVGSGSPCQDLSIAGKRAGLNGEKSSLFFVFVDILNYIKKVNPKVLFLQENVYSAKREDIIVMSEKLGVFPVMINSTLLTAQNRKRWYWTNIKTKKEGLFKTNVVDIPQPKDKKILLKDIITEGFVDRKKSRTILEGESRPFKNIKLLYRRYKNKGFGNIVYKTKNEIRIKTNTKKGYDIFLIGDCLNLAYIKSKTRRGRVTKGKAPCLLTGENPLYIIDQYNIRILNQLELERLQGFPDNYTSILTRNQAANVLGDGWTLPVIEHILSYFFK